jgi:hypothetical protein
VKSKSTLGVIAEQLLNEVNQETDIGDSIDVQVDGYFSSYENSAKRAKKEGRDFRMTVRRLVSEAEGDEPEAEEAPPKPAQPNKLTIESIDVESFTGDVLRLIENFESLVETRDTVCKRALSFLSESYDQTVLKEFKRALQDQGIIIGKSQDEHQSEDFIAPPAAGAGPGGAG